MIRERFGFWMTSALLACALTTSATAQEGAQSLPQARAGFETKLIEEWVDEEGLEQPNPELFSLVQVPTALGEMSAYLSHAPEQGKKFPAIIWIAGGFPPAGAGSFLWEPTSVDNDQSARQYRKAGMVMMYPTLRGTYGNAGRQESFYGEVDDILAALEFLSKVDYVDPDRIYLGGHSTGGTLALLVAASTDRFKAVFSFGPVAKPSGYGPDVLTYDMSDEKEDKLRSPIHYLDSIQTPTYVMEGFLEGNYNSLNEMKRSTENKNIKFWAFLDGDHFNLLAPANAVIAKSIMQPQGKLTQKDIQIAIDKQMIAAREATDLAILSDLRREGLDLKQIQTVSHYLYSWDLEEVAADFAKGWKDFKFLRGMDFTPSGIRIVYDGDGDEVFLMTLERKMTLDKLDDVFATSAAMIQLTLEGSCEYDDWSVDL